MTVRRILPVRTRISALAVSLVLWSGVPVLAQPSNIVRISNWELNLHAATLRPDLFDESAGALQFGGRVFRNFGSGLSVGANADWARSSDVTVAPFEGLSASLLLYSAEIGYDVRVSPRAVFHLGVGVGQAKLDIDRPLAAGAAGNTTGLLVPAGGGVKILNRSVDPTWAIRFDARDNVILLETLTADGTETEPRHNVEASVGFSFLFGAGGASRERVEQPDSDRDGVPDRQEPVAPPAEPRIEAEPAVEGPPDEDGDGVADFEDGCPGSPQGIDVGPDGCAFDPEAEPAATDSDGDGVLDARDACPGTPLGISVDARGCLARIAPQEELGEEEEDRPAAFPVPIAPDVRDAAPAGPDAAGACLDKSAGERAIEFDGRRFEPVGFPQPVDRLYLVQVGSFEDIPLFVSDTAEPPFGDFWVPVCGETGIYDLYVEAGAIP
ncbi:MAG TPA: outer membrane beta-barrel protein [Gemmatimonadota bacterium]|nr:outer membrane beta-barrel protein [Gemmatimonadota bacterium]